MTRPRDARLFLHRPIEETVAAFGRILGLLFHQRDPVIAQPGRVPEADTVAEEYVEGHAYGVDEEHPLS